MGSARIWETKELGETTVNAIYWGLGMEKAIKPNRSVAIVGDYNPLKPGFNYEKLELSRARLSTTSEKNIFFIYI